MTMSDYQRQQRACIEGREQRDLVRRSCVDRRSYRAESSRPISLPRWRAMIAHMKRLIEEGNEAWEDQ